MTGGPGRNTLERLGSLRASGIDTSTLDNIRIVFHRRADGALHDARHNICGGNDTQVTVTFPLGDLESYIDQLCSCVEPDLWLPVGGTAVLHELEFRSRARHLADHAPHVAQTDALSAVAELQRVANRAEKHNYPELDDCAAAVATIARTWGDDIRRELHEKAIAAGWRDPRDASLDDPRVALIFQRAPSWEIGFEQQLAFLALAHRRGDSAVGYASAAVGYWLERYTNTTVVLVGHRDLDSRALDKLSRLAVELWSNGSDELANPHNVTAALLSLREA